MKIKFLIIFFFSIYVLKSQTGPGGVDNSTNNVLWLKADAGTSTTTNGSSVSSWTDQSGNGNSVSQSTVNLQPLYQTNAINGFPTLLFDNVSSTNDYMYGADASSLDNTTGVTILTVTKPLNLDNSSARAIVSKRTNVDIDESYMLFYYTNNKVYCDFQTTNDRFNSSLTFSNNNSYIIDAIYDGTQAKANRCNYYINETSNGPYSETSSSISDNASPLVIGATNISDGRPFGGHIAEIIIYRKALNGAERIIVDNYLSAKYNITLSTNDYYAGDNSANGNYDYDVCGVGTDASGSSTSFATSRAAGLNITQNSGFGSGDYLLAGHKTITNSIDSIDVSGISGPYVQRWSRVWYWDITDAGSAMNVNVSFDLVNGGFPSASSVGPANKYQLIYRAGQSGAWTVVATANSTSGTTIYFTGVTPSADGYYTIATTNSNASPLPIQLINFSVLANNDKVDVSWETATETNNAFFTIEKSRDGKNFEKVIDVPGAGNSLNYKEYYEADYQPYEGVSYYRLKQTDYNGNYEYFSIESVAFKTKQQIRFYPDPVSTGESGTIETKGLANQEMLVVLRDMSGKEFYSKVFLVEENNQLIVIDTFHTIPSGTYLLVASSGNINYTRKVIVR